MPPGSGGWCAPPRRSAGGSGTPGRRGPPHRARPRPSAGRRRRSAGRAGSLHVAQHRARCDMTTQTVTSPAPLRRSPHDREIVRLAVPALGALAAEPLYLLADTAIVGHLGTNPLAGLAVAGTVLTAAFSVFNFLAYSTTASVARQLGAGNRRAAAEYGVDGCWLAAGLGLVLTAARAAPRARDRRRDGRVEHRPPVRGHVPADQHPRCPGAPAHARGRGLPARDAGHPHDARGRGRVEHRQPAPGTSVRLRTRPRHRGLRVGHGDRAGRWRHGVPRRARARRCPRGRRRCARARPGSAPTPRSAAGS